MTFVFSADSIFLLQCPSIHQKVYDEEFDRLEITPIYYVLQKKVNNSFENLIMNFDGNQISCEKLSVQRKYTFNYGNDFIFIGNTFEQQNDFVKWMHGVYQNGTIQRAFNTLIDKRIFSRDSNLSLNFNAIPHESGICVWDKHNLNIFVMDQNSTTENFRFYYRRFAIDKRFCANHNKFKCNIFGSLNNVFVLDCHKLLLEIKDAHKNLAYVLLRYNLTNLNFQQQILDYKKLLAISKTIALWLDFGPEKENSILTVHSLTDQKSRKFLFKMANDNFYSCFTNNEQDIFIGLANILTGNTGYGISVSAKEIFDNKNVCWKKVIWSSKALKNAFDLSLHKKITINPTAIALYALSPDEVADLNINILDIIREIGDCLPSDFN
jgi:hypothetical protein